MQEDIESWGWYNLKYDLAEVIIPKLESYLGGYLNTGVALPVWILDEPRSEFSDSEEYKLRAKWLDEVRHMISAFKQILNYKTDEDENMPYDEEFIQDGLNKFAKYFLHFWD